METEKKLEKLLIASTDFIDLMLSYIPAVISDDFYEEEQNLILLCKSNWQYCIMPGIGLP